MLNISQILFKIFEIFGEDGSGLLQYATSKENFNNSDSIIFKGAGKVFLEVCERDICQSVHNGPSSVPHKKCNSSYT